MKIILNGTEVEAEPESTVRSFLDAHNFKGKNLILEWNGEILPLEKAAETILHNGDSLNVFSLVGGG